MCGHHVHKAIRTWEIIYWQKMAWSGSGSAMCLQFQGKENLVARLQEVIDKRN